MGWHVFGRSERGYTTLAASPDLPEAIIEQLERQSFTWGQSTSVDYLSSLSTRAAYWFRGAVGKNEFAHTRILADGKDKAGRPRLRFITLVLSLRETRGGLQSLPSFVTSRLDWREAPGPATEAVEFRSTWEQNTRQPSPELDSALDELRQKDFASRILTPVDSVSLEQLGRAMSNLDDRELARFRVAFRALSDGVDACLIIPDRTCDCRSGMASRTGRTRPQSTPQSSRVAVFDRYEARSAHPRSLHHTREEPLEMNSRVLVAFSIVTVLVFIFGLTNMLLARSAIERTKRVALRLDDGIGSLSHELRRIETTGIDVARKSKESEAVIRKELLRVESALEQDRAATDSRIDQSRSHLEAQLMMVHRSIDKLQEDLTEGLTNDLGDILAAGRDRSAATTSALDTIREELTRIAQQLSGLVALADSTPGPGVEETAARASAARTDEKKKRKQ